MALPLPVLPPGFTDLNTVNGRGFNDTNVNIIGVVVDFLPTTKSAGTDFTIKFTLHDKSWYQGIGLSVRFFQKQEGQLPKIQNQGDVVLLRNVKLKNYSGTPTILSNSTSNWIVLEYSSLQESSDPHGTDVTIHQPGTGSFLAARPSRVELEYARTLLQYENPARWQQPAKPTSLQVAQIQRANGGTPPALPVKYHKVEELRVPASDKDQVYVDLFGEVRRIFFPNHDPPRAELSLTDYTDLQHLYNYVPEKENDDESVAFDGDRFRYIEGTYKAWPGPWGKKTILVLLWQPHRDFAWHNVKAGSFVLLKNVQIKLDRDGAKLEGHCRTDRHYETRVNVSVFKAREAEKDKRFIALLRRKREYEEYCKQRKLRFRRNPEDELTPKQKDASEGAEDTAVTGKAKRNRDNKRRKRIKKANGATTAREAEAEDSEEVTAGPSTNTHVRINNYDVPHTTIASILDPTILQRTTSTGNPFTLPFQNCKYKSKVRVIDYFPENLEDFAVPTRISQYTTLKGDDEDSASDVDIDMIDPGSANLSGSSGDGDGEIKWEWRFMLLVEDARPPAASAHPVATHMELLVAGSDADFLLRDIEACDLRRNPKILARLKEKLFVLWGDLQERKEETKKVVDGAVQGDGDVKASARPFECYIKEYGVKSEGGGRRVGEDV